MVIKRIPRCISFQFSQNAIVLAKIGARAFPPGHPSWPFRRWRSTLCMAQHNTMVLSLFNQSKCALTYNCLFTSSYILSWRGRGGERLQRSRWGLCGGWRTSDGLVVIKRCLLCRMWRREDSNPTVLKRCQCAGRWKRITVIDLTESLLTGM